MYFEKEAREEIWERYREAFGESEKMRSFAKKTLNAVKAEEAKPQSEMEKPKVEEEPKAEPVAEEPKVEVAPKVEEEPKVEAVPEAEATPKVEEAPRAEVAPKVEEEPKVEEAPRVEEGETDAERAGYIEKIKAYFNDKNKGLRRKVAAGILATLTAAGMALSAWGVVSGRDQYEAEVVIGAEPAVEAVAVPEFVPSAERIGANIELNTGAVGGAVGEFEIPAAEVTAPVVAEVTAPVETAKSEEAVATPEVVNYDVERNQYNAKGLWANAENNGPNTSKTGPNAVASAVEVREVVGDDAREGVVYVAAMYETLGMFIAGMPDAAKVGRLEVFRGMDMKQMETALASITDPEAYRQIYEEFARVTRGATAEDVTLEAGNYDNAFLYTLDPDNIVPENMILEKTTTFESGTPATKLTYFDENGRELGYMLVKTGRGEINGCMQVVAIHPAEVFATLPPAPETPPEASEPDKPAPEVPEVPPEAPEPENPEPEEPEPEEPTTITIETPPEETPPEEVPQVIIEQKNPESEIEHAKTDEDAAGYVDQRPVEGVGTPEQTVDMTEGGTVEVPQVGTPEQVAEQTAADQAAEQVAEQIESMTPEQRQEAEDNYIEEILNGGTI